MSQPSHEVKLYPLVSSYLDRIGYDANKRLLHVIFKDGDHYTYQNVGHDAFSALLNAESPGRHFHEHIKAKHRATKVS
jgi:KTSC domain-containing protein